MDLIAVILIAVGLAMDSFAVSICKGLSMRTPGLRSTLTVGLWFGAFQGIMPIIGYYLGSSFHHLISQFDYIVACILLLLIGLNMIREALEGSDEGMDADIGVRVMFLLAIATSIDALAVGISLALDDVGIFEPALIIGSITMVISMAGVKLGSIIGDRFSSKAEILGGLILIAIGMKILLEHLGLF
ncbi:MAG: manganese efflux pump [Thermoplasmata archaeon]|nr:manganese efflux pump [Thermoplasmata archaeon]